jgi:hypothetical protein
MFAFACDRAVIQAVRALAFPALMALGCAPLAGCADNQAAYAAATPDPAVYVPHVAVEMEGDGLPSQPAPSARVLQLPDDPSEPYSRNYGGPNPAAKIPNTVPPNSSADASPIPAPIPEDVRRRIAVASDD